MFAKVKVWMRIVEINMVANGSTGKIMRSIVEVACSNGHDALSFSPYMHTIKRLPMPECGKKHIYYGSCFESAIHKVIGRFLGANGIGSYFATKKLLKKLMECEPDVIHLHNLHSFCFNLPVFFRYLKKNI